MLPTAEETQRRRQMALALLQKGMDTSPVQHWTQGLARVLQAGMGGWQAYRADADSRAREARTAANFANLPGLPGLPGLENPAPASAPQRAGTAPASAPQRAGTAPAAAAGSGHAAEEGDFERRLIQRESAGSPEVRNSLGYAGKYQFGAPRLADLGLYRPGEGETVSGKWGGRKWSGTFAIPGHEKVRTIDDFLANPEAQRAAWTAHLARMDQEITRMGLDRYIGTTVGGVRITREGLYAMMHIGGAGGTRAVLASGGRYNPSDINGTSVLDYAREFSGGGTPVAVESPDVPASAVPQPSAAPPVSAQPAGASEQPGFRIDPQVGQYIQTLLRDPATREYGIKLYNSLIQKYALRDPKEAERRQQEMELNRRKLELENARLALERAKLDPERTAAERARADLELEKLKADVQRARADAARAASPNAGRPHTEFEAKEAKFAWRMEKNEREIEEIMQRYNPGSVLNAFWPDDSVLNSQEWRQYQAAARQWIYSFLRDDSGAATPETEVTRYFTSLFAQPGEGPETAALKKRMRAEVMRATRAAAGPAYDRLFGGSGGAAVAPGYSAGPPKLSTDREVAERQYEALPSGTQFIDPEGILRTKP